MFEGYGFGRRSCYTEHLGPRGWQQRQKGARQLLEAFLSRRGHDTIVVDCLKSHTAARSWLQSFEFTCSRPSLACIVAQIIIRAVPNDSVPILGLEIG